MRQTPFFLLKLLIIQILTLVCVLGYHAKAESLPGKLHLLFTSDIHGWLSTAKFYPKRKQSGLLHLKDQIVQLKNKYNNLILIDAGDLLQGSPLVHYYHYVKNSRADDNPFFMLVKELKYDAVVVGNHDLSLNPEFENEYVVNSNFSWLAANAYRKTKNAFTPYIIRNQNGLKVIILGFTTPGVHMWLGPDQLQGIEVESLESSVRKWIRKVKSNENPDFLVGVFHVGLSFFRDDENSKLNRVPPANSLRSILKENTEFDLVVSGHDHRLYPYKQGQDIRYISGTPVISPGHSGKAALLVDVDFEKQKSQWKVKAMEVSIKKSTYYKSISARLNTYNSTRYNAYISERLPWLFTTGTKKEVQECMNQLLALSCDEQDLDGTFFPGVSIYGLKELTGRHLIRSDLFKWIKYDNKSVLVRLNQRDIDLLLHPIPEYGSRKIPYNRILIPWFKKNIKMEPASLWLKKGNKFGKRYRFKLTDYHFWGGGGLKSKLFISNDDLIKISKKFQRDKLFEYLKVTKLLPDSCHFLRYNPI